MLEVRRDRQRFGIFIRKLFRKNPSESFAKLFTRKLACAWLEIQPQKLQSVGLRVAEALHGQRQAFIGMIRDSQHPPR